MCADISVGVAIAIGIVMAINRKLAIIIDMAVSGVVRPIRRIMLRRTGRSYGLSTYPAVFDRRATQRDGMPSQPNAGAFMR